VPAIGIVEDQNVEFGHFPRVCAQPKPGLSPRRRVWYPPSRTDSPLTRVMASGEWSVDLGRRSSPGSGRGVGEATDSPRASVAFRTTRAPCACVGESRSAPDSGRSVERVTSAVGSDECPIPSGSLPGTVPCSCRAVIRPKTVRRVIRERLHACDSTRSRRADERLPSRQLSPHGIRNQKCCRERDRSPGDTIILVTSSPASRGSCLGEIPQGRRVLSQSRLPWTFCGSSGQC